MIWVYGKGFSVKEVIERVYTRDIFNNDSRGEIQ